MRRQFGGAFGEGELPAYRHDAGGVIHVVVGIGRIAGEDGGVEGAVKRCGANII
jgi:hypothetical protein